jgi:CheY-like chemotaxis protein
MNKVKEYPMNGRDPDQVVELLLVEDNAADVRLTQEALNAAKVINNLNVVGDGVEAMQFLRRQGEFRDAKRPDVILLDLNLPRKDGREVLREIKDDPDLKTIPVVILSTSQAEQDIVKTYELHANCYITKPLDLDQFITIIRNFNDFWLRIVRLPGDHSGEQSAA